MDRKRYEELAQGHQPKLKEEVFKDTYLHMLTNSEQLNFYNILDLEQIAYQQIKAGDVEAADRLFKSHFIKGIDDTGIYSANYRKNMEYVSVVCVILTSRAAIDSGISVQCVYAIRNSLLQRISEAETLQEYYDLSYEAFIGFTYLIHREKQASSGDNRIEQMKGYIKNNIGTPLQMNSIAEVFHMNPDYMARLFKKKEGISIGDYIIKTRIDISCDLLRYTTYSLSDITAIVGFSSQSYFGRKFKSHTGETPGDYRKNHKRSLAMSKL